MKKVTFLFLFLFFFSLVPASFMQAREEVDFQAIKKAVKKNPNYKSGQEAKWFKVLVSDNETNRDTVRITLPLAVVELLVMATGDHNLSINRDDCDVDLKELYKELKKLGPMVLIEVFQDGKTVKIWLE